MNKRYPNGALNLIVKTWDKDTNGLFDYSSKQTINSKETIENSATIIRKDNFIKASNDEPKKEALFNISKNGANKYLIENKIEINMEANVENIAKINNKFWYVVNDNQSLEDNNKIKNRNKNYYLVKNDIIKLGRLKFVLTEDSFSSGDTKFELSVPNKDSFSFNSKEFLINTRVPNLLFKSLINKLFVLKLKFNLECNLETDISLILISASIPRPIVISFSFVISIT